MNRISLSHTVTKSFIKEKLKFDLDAEENKHLLDHLKIFPDGTIISCDRDFLSKYIDDKDFGLQMTKAIPWKERKINKIENEDDFIYILACCTDPEDYL